MNGLDEIQKKIEGIRSDRVHGASELAHTALVVLAEALQINRSESISDFVNQIDAYAGELVAARPTMVMIANCVNRCRRVFKQLQCDEQDLAHLKIRVRQAITDVIADIARERNQTIENGAALIHTNSVIMTCSYSSTVITVLQLAAGQGKSLQTLAVASNASCCYAQMTIDCLGESGIIGEVIPESQLPEVLPLADCIITGADAITADGTLINGSPSLALALAARDRNPHLPFYVICEPLKFTLSIPPTLEPGFDLIPSELLTAVITAK